MMHLKIECVPGNVAPKYSEGTELVCEKVVITEQGLESGFPIVDFVMRGPDGKLYLLVLTGGLVNMVSSAIKGTNMRNHGREE
jgi:hypothetical protein